MVEKMWTQVGAFLTKIIPRFCEKNVDPRWGILAINYTSNGYGHPRGLSIADGFSTGKLGRLPCTLTKVRIIIRYDN